MAGSSNIFTHKVAVPPPLGWLGQGGGLDKGEGGGTQRPLFHEKASDEPGWGWDRAKKGIIGTKSPFFTKKSLSHCQGRIGRGGGGGGGGGRITPPPLCTVAVRSAGRKASPLAFATQWCPVVVISLPSFPLAFPSSSLSLPLASLPSLSLPFNLSSFCPGGPPKSW